jgi:hypothetical protein
MLRKFEEVGVRIDGVAYGLFSGEAEFDRTGQVVTITVEPSDTGGPPLVLDISKLVPERIALRRKYGNGFLEDGSSEVRSHARRYELFMAMSETIEKAYADDIRDYLADVRQTSRFDAA